MHRWDEAWPWVAIQVIVEATGAAERSVRDWKASLVTKGYLQIRTRGRAGGGRGADEHNLAKLFAALEALALEDEIQRVTEQARDQLPLATYYRDWSSVPRMAPPSARKLQTQRVRDRGKAAENRRNNAAENRRSNLPETASLIRRFPASEEEAIDKNPVQETSHKERTGLAAPRPELTEEALLSELSSEETPPGYYDEGISLQITECATEFDDDDLERSIARAQRMWWNSKLDRGYFQNAVKDAMRSTRLRRSQIRDTPMGYFFKVLAGAVEDQRYRAGLSGRPGVEQLEAVAV
jgi:hypothetical protein